jgi:hypothetical protein
MARLEAASAEKARNRGLHLEDVVISITEVLNSSLVIAWPVPTRRQDGKIDATAAEQMYKPLSPRNLYALIPDPPPPAGHAEAKLPDLPGHYPSQLWDRIIPRSASFHTRIPLVTLAACTPHPRCKPGAPDPQICLPYPAI